MKHRSSTLGSALRATLALALIGAIAPNAVAAASPIYKCFDKSLSVVYTDLPCRDGEVVDIRAGNADPAAIARLERERDALDRSSAQRITDLRRAQLERSFSTANYGPDYGAYAPGYDGETYADAGLYLPYGYGYGYGLLSGAPRGRQQGHDGRFDRRGARQHVVPNRITPPPNLRPR
jgi:hypothetical protein